MGTPGPEQVVKRAICDYLHARGYCFWLNHTVGIYDRRAGCYRRNNSKYDRNGIADILGILNDGRFLAIEVKTRSGRVSEEQQAFLEDITRRGGVGFVARSVEDVKLFL